MLTRCKNGWDAIRAPTRVGFSLLIDRKTSCSVIVMVSKIISGIRLSCVIVFIDSISKQYAYAE